MEVLDPSSQAVLDPPVPPAPLAGPWRNMDHHIINNVIVGSTLAFTWLISSSQPVFVSGHPPVGQGISKRTVYRVASAWSHLDIGITAHGHDNYPISHFMFHMSSSQRSSSILSYPSTTPFQQLKSPERRDRPRRGNSRLIHFHEAQQGLLVVPSGHDTEPKGTMVVSKLTQGDSRDRVS